MIKIEIPGTGLKQIEHLVLDYNGTLAIDGNMIPGVKEKLNLLAEKISVHVISADTFGKAQDGLNEVCCEYIPTSDENQAKCKQDYVTKLGAQTVIAIGNGANDALMLKDAEIGIVLIQKEGASVNSLTNADIVCTEINDALDLLLHPLRIAATLRV
jgi:P-type E1-E2 ATPase